MIYGRNVSKQTFKNNINHVKTLGKFLLDKGITKQHVFLFELT